MGDYVKVTDGPTTYEGIIKDWVVVEDKVLAVIATNNGTYQLAHIDKIKQIMV